MNTENLTALPRHARVQEAINALIADGAPPSEAAEIAFAVAAAAKIGTDGLRETSRQLFLLATRLSQVADQTEGDLVAARH